MVAKASNTASGKEDDRQSGRGTGISTPPKQPPPSTAQSFHDRQNGSPIPSQPETPAPFPVLTAELDRLQFERTTALAKSSETDDDRALRRIHAEEMASSLRDDKLLNLVTGPQLRRGNSFQGEYAGVEGGGPTHALTQENVQRLAKEGELAYPRSQEDRSSVAMEPPSRSESITGAPMRPVLNDRFRESDTTVTPHLMRY
jgi:hypothetical protein